MAPAASVLEQVEQCVLRDPARRGLLGAEIDSHLCPGHFAAAVHSLARFGRRVWILTGFYIAGGSPPAAETDGPPGAAMLAAALLQCGMDPWLLTDRYCAAAVKSSAAHYGVGEERVLVCPDNATEFAAWTDHLLQCRSEPLTHVVSIERSGPSHSPSTWSAVLQRNRFAGAVPAIHWDRCHNMRGEVIDATTPPLYLVMEWIARERPAVRTIGVGDGGNEIGMGALPWHLLGERLANRAGSIIPCRVPTDWTIVAGVSNWGAMALAAGVCWSRDALAVIAPWDRAFEEAGLQRLVSDGPAVDGVTRLQEPTVDGLPFLTYIQPWEAIRMHLALADGVEKPV